MTNEYELNENTAMILNYITRLIENELHECQRLIDTDTGTNIQKAEQYKNKLIEIIEDSYEISKIDANGFVAFSKRIIDL